MGVAEGDAAGPAHDAPCRRQCTRWIGQPVVARAPREIGSGRKGDRLVGSGRHAGGLIGSVHHQFHSAVRARRKRQPGDALRSACRRHQLV